MKIFIQKISLLVIGIVGALAVNAQTIQVSASAAGLTETIANGGSFDARSFMTATLNLKDYLPVTVSIKNTGSVALTMTQAGGKYIVLSGTGASDFTINESSLTGTIAAGATQTFTVNLSSSATNGNNKTVTMSIANNSNANSTNGFYTGNIQYNLSNITTSLTKASDIGLSLYPNPSNDGHIFVSADNIQVQRIVVSNVAGQTEEFASKEFQTTMKGLLLVRLYTDKGVVSEKIIIQE